MVQNCSMPPEAPSGGPPGPCPRISAVSAQLLVGGLGGLNADGVSCLLQEHAITHLVVCGRRGVDAHVAAAEAAAKACETEVHVAALVPPAEAEVLGILEEAAEFVNEALSDELNCVLVTCSKGASRSVAVVLAYLMRFREETPGAFGLEQTFEAVVAARWRVWPSALLVQALLTIEARWLAAARRPLRPASLRATVCRLVGCHGALATAWHNGATASLADAEAAWDQAAAGERTEASLETSFRACKQRLLGLAEHDFAAYEAAGPGREPTEPLSRCQPRPPHARADEVEDGLLLCGLGGLLPEDVEALLREHDVVQAVVCGLPGRDAHVAALVRAMEALDSQLALAGNSCAPAQGGTARVRVVPVADSADQNILAHLEVTCAFLEEATSACARRGGRKRVLVACRQGASRSASVVVAWLMTSRGLSALEAFRWLAARRWRLWPNAGFVGQLLRLEDKLRQATGAALLTDQERQATFRAVGVHAAWAANRQNLEENGSGRLGLSLEDVEGLWEQAVGTSEDEGVRFETCKALALGVDLASFSGPPCAKRRRGDAAD